MLLVRRPTAALESPCLARTAWKRDAGGTECNILNDVGEKHATSVKNEAKIIAKRNT
jgi:hypothetical protein